MQSSAWRIGGIVMAVASLAPAPCLAASYGGCRFDAQTLRFAGTVAESATCLLRRVKVKGAGSVVQPVPDWLLARITKPFPISAGQVASYLASHNIDAAQLTDRLVVGDAPSRRYFVIHDTSWPEDETSSTQFPANIDDLSYPGNSLAGWQNVARKVNLIVNRVGQSRRLQEWQANRPSPATKIEQSDMVPAARALFVHVENIQPRHKPSGSWGWIAPVPGFSPAQEERLALAYVIASMRAGRWLIPAYHFNIDEGIADGHDDPQNTDLASWTARVAAIEADMLSR